MMNGLIEPVSCLSLILHFRDLDFFSLDYIKGLLEWSGHIEKPCHHAHNIAVQYLQNMHQQVEKIATFG